MESLNACKLIRLSKSCIGDAEKQAVMGVLDREYLGMGTEVQQFEQALSDFFGRPAVCVANGTAALHLALQACGIGPGDEVLVQSLTYVASFQAISATGAIPVACDVDPSTLTLDWCDAEKRMTSRTKAVMPVHYAGGVGALDEIYDFANKYGLRVIEDAAHAFGTTYQNKRVGGFGDISCFSFDGIKNITSGEGGCIVTSDSKILEQVQDARLLGVEKDTQKRFSGQRSWAFDVSAQGWRYHMSNIMAAIGIEQLKRFPAFAAKRRKLARFYDAELEGISSFKSLKQDYDQVVPHIYPILVGEAIDWQLLQNKLKQAGIQTGVHYQPNHRLSFYKKKNMPIPSFDAINHLPLSLPLHPDLDKSDVERVCHELRSVSNK
ncbi:DegT/DnrJ/EryC1/StrS family aminotransferase [Alphaproteobacteria bacterium LSUCC0744]